MWGRGEGDFLKKVPFSPPPHPLPSSFKDFSLYRIPHPQLFTMPKNHSPMDDTIPDPAVVIKKRPNTRTYPGVFTFLSNGTAAGRPPNQSKVLREREREREREKGASRVAVFGRERRAVGVLSPSPERFPFPSPIPLSHSVSTASRGASAAPPRRDTTYTRQNPQAPASWLR